MAGQTSGLLQRIWQVPLSAAEWRHKYAKINIYFSQMSRTTGICVGWEGALDYISVGGWPSQCSCSICRSKVYRWALREAPEWLRNIKRDRFPSCSGTHNMAHRNTWHLKQPLKVSTSPPSSINLQTTVENHQRKRRCCAIVIYSCIQLNKCTTAKKWLLHLKQVDINHWWVT